MTRTRTSALCLAAVLALGGFAASSASALPEVGRCVAQAGGRYADANCRAKASKGAGAFEFKKGAVKKGFASTGGEGVLETAAGTKVVCKTQTASGELRELSGAIREVQHVTAKFQGCAIPALGITCGSQGAPAGEIVTTLLGGKLGYISGKGTKAPVAGQELHPEAKKGLFAEFACGGGAVSVKVGEGSGKGGDCIIAVVEPVNVSSTTANERYSGAGGAQNPQHFEGSTRTCNLESSLNGGAYERATLTLVATVTSEEPLEIRA